MSSGKARLNKIASGQFAEDPLLMAGSLIPAHKLQFHRRPICQIRQVYEWLFGSFFRNVQSGSLI